MKIYFVSLIVFITAVVLPQQVQGFSIKKMFGKFAGKNGNFHKISEFFTRKARTTDNNTMEIEILGRQINNTNVKNGENVLRWQLATLKITSPESLLALIVSEENCFKLKEMIDSIEQNCEGCRFLGNDTLYIRLYEGAKKFHSIFCVNEDFKKKITQYQACFKDLREEYIDCEGEGDWFENSNRSLVCDTCTEIIECNYIRTAEECGDDAAFYLTCLSKPIFEKILVPTCDFPKLKELEKFEKAEAAKIIAEISSNGNSLQSSILQFILISLTVSIFSFKYL